MLRRSLLLSICASCLAQIQPPAFLLPDDVVPKKYTIDLSIDPSQAIFTGVARIDVEVKSVKKVIWINGKDLTPISAVVFSNGRSVDASAESASGEFMGLDLESPVGPGPATISIRYQGRLDEKSVVGPYRKKVGDDWYIFTTFTPIDARRAFPCFDEPRFKTPWTLQIHTRRDLKVFANGAEESVVEEPGNMKLTRFAETKPLPTEVIAFAVGPFDVVEGAAAGHGTPIRVITTRGFGAAARPALEATVDVLPRLEAYTGIPYPFGKLDHVALPEGAFDAVENPGLITYRQTALLAAHAMMPLVDVTPEKKRAIRSIESHEIAHQWFGDLVTQATWKDVWLSEGFATWLSAKVMEEEQPAARKRLAAVASRERITAAETGPRARPVRLVMNNREEMRGVYGRVVYDKGASILLMLDGWLGEDKVRDGLRAYLKQHAFGNATTADLESALRASAGVDPAPVMDAYLDQQGIPIVRGECRDGKISIEPAGAWPVPVCVRGEGLSQTCGVIDRTHREIDLKRTCPAWMYFNSGATGYYRTNWSAAQMGALVEGLTRLSAAERLTLVFDLHAQFGLTKPGAEASALLARLAADSEPEIAKAASDAIVK